MSEKLVKELKEKTSVYIIDCKKVVKETARDINEAIEWLREKGIPATINNEGKVTAEGLVESYIHRGSRIGVLLELSFQRDFVTQKCEFKQLVKNVAMQIASYPHLEYLSVDDIPTEFIESEKSIEMGREDLINKPENIREKIVKGRMERRLKELTLMDKPFIGDQNKTLEELIKETSYQLGDKIKLCDFIRFIVGEDVEKQEINFAEEVGEGVEKQESNFSEEVAAKTEKKIVEISANLVKELRKKTGRGMMDCKKALKETNGDMNKAIEWLKQNPPWCERGRPIPVSYYYYCIFVG